MTVQTLAIVVLLVSFFVMIFLRFPIAYAVGLSSVLCLMVQGQALTDVCRLMVKGISSLAVDKASAMRCPKASSPSCVKREALPPCAA